MASSERMRANSLRVAAFRRSSACWAVATCPALIGRTGGFEAAATLASVAEADVNGMGRADGFVPFAGERAAATGAEAEDFRAAAVFVALFFAAFAFLGAGFADFRFGADFTRDGIFFLQIAVFGRNPIFYDAN